MKICENLFFAKNASSRSVVHNNGIDIMMELKFKHDSKNRDELFFLDFKGQNKDFWITTLSLGQFNHGEPKIRGHETLGV